MGSGGSDDSIHSRSSQRGDGDTDDAVPPEDEPAENGPAMGDKCAIEREARLDSPKSALDTVSEGDVLSVEIRGKSVDVVTSSGDVVGSIAEPWVKTLRECIEDGHTYRAKILWIDNGNCDVLIFNR